MYFRIKVFYYILLHIPLNNSALNSVRKESRTLARQGFTPWHAIWRELRGDAGRVK